MEEVKKTENVFIYNSPVGKFFIQYDFRIKKWSLGIEDEILGHYPTSVAAADDVYCQATSFYDWDAYDIDTILEEVPTDIYCWEYYKRNK